MEDAKNANVRILGGHFMPDSYHFFRLSRSANVPKPGFDAPRSAASFASAAANVSNALRSSAAARAVTESRVRPRSSIESTVADSSLPIGNDLRRSAPRGVPSSDTGTSPRPGFG